MTCGIGQRIGPAERPAVSSSRCWSARQSRRNNRVGVPARIDLFLHRDHYRLAGLESGLLRKQVDFHMTARSGLSGHCTSPPRGGQNKRQYGCKLPISHSTCSPVPFSSAEIGLPDNEDQGPVIEQPALEGLKASGISGMPYLLQRAFFELKTARLRRFFANAKSASKPPKKTPNGQDLKWGKIYFCIQAWAGLVLPAAGGILPYADAVQRHSFREWGMDRRTWLKLAASTAALAAFPLPVNAQINLSEASADFAAFFGGTARRLRPAPCRRTIQGA